MILKKILTIAAFSVALVSSSLATVPTSSSNACNYKPIDFDKYAYAYKCKVEKFCKWKKDHQKDCDKPSVKKELQAQLWDLKQDAYELKKLVASTFKLILDGKLTVTDPAYTARLNSYLAQVNDINADIASIEALLASGNYGGAQAKLDKITGKLTGIIAAGNLIFPPGVSLHA